jgi:hypothetical protein
MPALTLIGERQARAARRIEVALDSIQEAQQLVQMASQALAAIAGMGSERKRLACLSHQLTWAWVAVAATNNRARRQAR